MENIKKNTVSAKNQLKNNNCITYENLNGSGLRVMFVGNSITRHSVKHEIGWSNDWGMAASCLEHDYVHVMIEKLNQTNSDVAYCICQCADWESEYWNGEAWLTQYSEARDFEADIIIMRIIENCPWDEFDGAVFKQEYDRLISYLNKTGMAKIILTTGFWHHVGDEMIKEYATEKNYPLVELGDLGDNDVYKAIGLFEHSGVANHPGDEGMKQIARRILAQISSESYKLYPVIQPIDRVDDYEVKVNGKVVELDTARVSAHPLNRRWPGHQRGLEQTELINFLSLEVNGPVDFEIKPKEPFEDVIIRPLSLGIKPEITAEGIIKFTLEKNAYFTVEPYGRNHALHIFADPTSKYDIDIHADNVIYFGKGEHDAGMIHLESNQTLFIDEGAVVYGCIRAFDAENIKILGRGILDNSKNKEKILFEYNAEKNDTAVNNVVREHTVQIEYCTNVEIDGITIRDSLVYNIRPIACKNLNISNLKIIGCWRYNSDGIDMHNCENVLIDNCFIRTFDDSICVKGFDCYYEGDVEQAVHDAMYRNGKAYDVFKNVLVKNCTIWNDWGKSLEIGAETRAEEICDITFEDCNIIHVTHQALHCYNVDYADVHDVTYKNINVEYDDIIYSPAIQNNDQECYINRDESFAPDLIGVSVEYHHEYSAGGSRRGKNHNFLFANIRLYGKYAPRLFFKGYDEEHKTKDIVIENVFWNGELLKKIKEDNFVLGEYTDNITYKVGEEAICSVTECERE